MTYVIEQKDLKTVNDLIDGNICLDEQHIPLLLAWDIYGDAMQLMTSKYNCHRRNLRNMFKLALATKTNQLFLIQLIYTADKSCSDCRDLFDYVDICDRNIMVTNFIRDSNFDVLRYLKTVWIDTFANYGNEHVYINSRYLCDSDVVELLNIFDIYQFNWREVRKKILALDASNYSTSRRI